MRRILLALLLIISGLIAILLFRGLPRSSADPVSPAEPLALDTLAIAQHLASAIQIPTISDGVTLRAAELTQFRELLGRTYPRLHAALPHELVAGHSLLFVWPGSDRTLSPLLLVGHMDVVPVSTGSEARWQHPPFRGVIVDGEVWGRGALDDKHHVITIMDAVELLLTQGFTPRRTVYLFFGHDEEAVTTGGAAQAAALLKQRGIRFDFVLDEGGIIGQGMVAGVKKPVALVRTAEKGYLTLELSVSGTGGHSSAPARPTTVGQLSRALVALEEKPFRARLVAPLRGLLEATANEQPLATRVVLRNLWLFRPVVLAQLSRTPATDASIRTTIAPTMLSGSPKDNVLPTRASATVNFRILPGETSESVIAHVRNAIDDEGVTIRVVSASEPPPASSASADQFARISRTIRQISPEVVVAPFLLGAATDSRMFSGLSDHIYGFSMARGGPDLLERTHGTNERIAVRDLANSVRFYAQLIRNSQ